MRMTLMVKTKGLGDILATVALEHPGFAVIGIGATETIASLEALEVILNIRFSKFGHHCRQGIEVALQKKLHAAPCHCRT